MPVINLIHYNATLNEKKVILLNSNWVDILALAADRLFLILQHFLNMTSSAIYASLL